MAPPASTKIIDSAFSRSSPYALSYTNPEQKWLIREHLLSLLHDFPTLSPSADTFFHDDGNIVYILNASGHLPISSATPPVPLTIWLHQDYPFSPPIVFLSPTPTTPLLPLHPFVHPSGLTTSPYLNTWRYPHSNLSDLAHNLVCLFSHHHPFFSPSASSSAATCRFTHPALASKVEAIDGLFGAILCDMLDLGAKADDDIHELMALQAELLARADIITTMLLGLEHERTTLIRRVKKLTEESDILINWLKVNGSNAVVATSEDDMEAFEAADEESRSLLDSVAADLAIEDCIYELDRAVERGVITFHQYIKQVRALAREQFFYRLQG
ncbi:PREDICTED: protein ELC-like [Nelumbo nucifera]|uniref:Protein ELC-like n=2 Tax=Nelumbo nucifera TaxID=4432 RepID=A0A1U8BPA6_NELNU|nr:PREDICTED: protein ELC-like [Nelumbo nucifera]DAD19705.1 TPA_asm: hypothetical protein HUJ06_021168 [Nelumbo nucifera]